MCITRSAAEFHDFVARNDVHSFVHVSEQMDRITYRRPVETVKAPRTNSLPICVFVTSYARLLLYRYMCEAERNGAVILYCDTDSIYYVIKIGKYPGRFWLFVCLFLWGISFSAIVKISAVIEGRRLGQMSREHADRLVAEFIAAAPKNYGFRHRRRRRRGGDNERSNDDDDDERAVLKVRGFRLNYDAAQVNQNELN